MRRNLDKVSNKILRILKRADEPLETREIEDSFKHASRVKILYRLNLLRGENLIKGKLVGSGKGTWIWWCKK